MSGVAGAGGVVGVGVTKKLFWIWDGGEWDGISSGLRDPDQVLKGARENLMRVLGLVVLPRGFGVLGLRFGALGVRFGALGSGGQVCGLGVPP